jgi:hypothetical protein
MDRRDANRAIFDVASQPRQRTQELQRKLLGLCHHALTKIGGDKISTSWTAGVRFLQANLIAAARRHAHSLLHTFIKLRHVCFAADLSCGRTFVSIFQIPGSRGYSENRP